MSKLTWPAWFSSPKGDATAIFEKAEDVPTGWTSGAEKQTAGSSSSSKATPTPTPSPAPTPTPAPAATPPSGESGNVELDTAGWPWTADLHASSKSKTKDGLWRMKVGVSRPDPKPGYPLDL